jgi:hypothetical protein
MHAPRGELVILVREAGRTALSLDLSKGLIRLLHVGNVVVHIAIRSAVDDVPNGEDARANGQTVLDSGAFLETRHCIRTRAA